MCYVFRQLVEFQTSVMNLMFRSCFVLSKSVIVQRTPCASDLNE
jgi:hypothetical protein